MDFEKAFDKVPHRRLAYMLEYYGIRNDILVNQGLAIWANTKSFHQWSVLRPWHCVFWCLPGFRIRIRAHLVLDIY